MKSLYIILILLSAVLLGCDEPFQLDSKQAPSTIVIEGLVTNKPEYQSVKISKSSEFYSSGKTPRVTDAIVTVSDELGNVYNFVHNPRNHPDSAGIYIPETVFGGFLERTYTLRVEAKGEVYEATDKLMPVINIDSLSYRIDEDEQEDPEIDGRFYEVLLFAKEPQDQENYYLFKFYRNDSLTFQNETDIYYSDDELLAENIDGIPTPIYYSKGDMARVDAFSISRNGYIFYNDLSGLLNNDSGGMFGPIPSSPRTNLSNGALGFFQVSAVTTSYIQVE